MPNNHEQRSNGHRGVLQARQGGGVPGITIPGVNPPGPPGGTVSAPSPPSSVPQPPAAPSPATTSSTTTPAPAPPPPVTTPSSTTTSTPDRTITSTSTSTIPITSSSRSTTSSAVVPSTTSTTSIRQPSTIFNTVITRLSSSSASAAAISTSAAADTSSGPGAGTVVGAVAGALVGVVVLSGLIGYLFRAKFAGRKDDYDEDDPFSRGDFRRESQMLPDDYDDGMSQISGGSRHQNLGRSDTMVSGMGSGSGPRPPTFIQRHIYNTQASPGFPPSAGPYYGNNGFPPMPPVVGDAGGWGVAASYTPRGASPTQDLARQPTVRSEYAGDHYGGQQQQQQHLDHVAEEEELPSRSGTPTNANPQSAYYHHGSRDGSNATATGRRMSVRNGGLDAYDDVYDGYQ